MSAIRITRQIVEVLGKDPTFPTLVDASSPISLTSTASVGFTKSISATSTIALTQTASVKGTKNLSALSEVTRQELDPETLEIIEVGLSQNVGLGLTVSKSIVDSIPLTQDADGVRYDADAEILTADSTISLAHSSLIVEEPLGDSVITVTDSADVMVVKPLYSTLELTHEASVSGTWARSAESEIELTQSVGMVYIPGGGVKLCESDIDLDGPYTGVTSPFALIYPATGGATDTVELKAPNLGNRDRLSFDKINEETRGGTLIVFADPIWPKVQTLALTFSGLTSAEGQELLRFMQEHLGEEIRLSDWEQRVWRGIITTPNEPLVQDGPGCQFTASFEFEGELTTPP